MDYEIRKYQNRKYYDPQQQKMVTLRDIVRLVRAGKDVRVVDNRTGSDITIVTLTKTFLESVRNREMKPLGIVVQTIRSLIRSTQGVSMDTDLLSDAAHDNADIRMGDLVEETVELLVTRGVLDQEEARTLIVNLQKLMKERLEELHEWIVLTIDQRLARYAIPSFDRPSQRRLDS
jgi:hypothetical protein